MDWIDPNSPSGTPQGQAGMDPAFMAALMAGSSGSEDQANLMQQMKMAQSLRSDALPANAMAGHVAARVTPIAGALHGLSDYMSMSQQMKALHSMRQNAEQLRKMRGLIQQKILENSAGSQAIPQNNPDPYGTQGAAAAMQAANAPVST